MPKLHLFNPSHEMALAADTAQYTPTKHVGEMERKQCRLPLKWADPDDFVVTPEGIINTKGNIVPLSPDMIPAPWGWNKAVKRRFIRMGVAESLMPTDEELKLWRTFASRRWAANYAKHLYAQMDDTSFVVENHIQFCNDNSELNEWMAGNEGYNYILKSEYSSSGRGNCIGRMRQAPVLADRFYTKIIDFALEYEITQAEVHYLGLSVFKATKEGRYEGNCHSSQPELREMILQNLNNQGDKQLSTLIDTHLALLSQTLLHRYRGYVGIDLLATDKQQIHPCIEINLRMNMGIAHILSNKNTYPF